VAGSGGRDGVAVVRVRDSHRGRAALQRLHGGHDLLRHEPLRGRLGGLQFRGRTHGFDERIRVVGVLVDARHVGQHDQLAAQRGRNRGGRAVGVGVDGGELARAPTATSTAALFGEHRHRDDRDVRSGQQGRQQVVVDRLDCTRVVAAADFLPTVFDDLDRGLARAGQKLSVGAREADRVHALVLERGHEVGVEFARQDHLEDLHCGLVGEPTNHAAGGLDVLGVFVEAFESIVHRRRTAVDDHHVLAVCDEVGDVGQRALGFDRSRAADFDDDGGALVRLAEGSAVGSQSVVAEVVVDELRVRFFECFRVSVFGHGLPTGCNP